VTGLRSRSPVSLSATSSRDGGVVQGAPSSENVSYMHDMNDNDADEQVMACDVKLCKILCYHLFSLLIVLA
jgi:hypothetical protein